MNWTDTALVTLIFMVGAAWARNEFQHRSTKRSLLDVCRWLAAVCRKNKMNETANEIEAQNNIANHD